MPTDHIAAELAENLALYADDDPDRVRFAHHSMIAAVMDLAARNGLELVDLIAEGVDLYELRGGETELPGGGPRAFFGKCARAVIG